MTRFNPLIFALLFASLLCGVVFAAETPAQKAAHKVIAGNYLRYGRAFEIKDLAAIMALTAPDYTSRGLRGDLQNRAEFEREMRAAFASAHRVSPASAQIMSFQWQQNEAIVVVKQTVRLVFLRDNKPRRYQNITLARDTWVHTPRGWQVRQSVTLAENITLDGKKVAS
ncbi:MAG: nuclear transport factor 2 family protein [Armatimonadetes bacterium]|nr:nuclear transport factor 2 family protein [Armatimonadota bacterium]